MEDFEEELKHEFLKEAEEMLGNAENAYIALESNRTNEGLLDEIFRIAHNLKGTSMAFQFHQMADLTHVAENLILKLKQGELEVSDEAITVLLEFNDKVKEMIIALKADFNALVNVKTVEQNLVKVTNNGKAAPPEPKAEEPKIEEKKEEVKPAPDKKEEISPEEDLEMDRQALELIKAGGDIDPEKVKEMERQIVEKEKKLNQSKEEAVPSPPPGPTTAQPKPPASKPPNNQAQQKRNPVASKEDESIRVNLGRIEKLNNIVGELVILQTVLEQRRYIHCKDDLINKSIGQLEKLSKEIQEISMSLRMVPLKPTFQKMSRIVRDTSKSLNKIVKLSLVGEETEVDKTVLEYLADPLVHIIRNAVDHGLESTEDREKFNKDKQGNVELLAFHEGSNLVIQVTDDGKGIHPDVIRNKAIEKGLISHDQVINDEDIIQYIFHPGFSTKEQVSELSGRGVGMDVVKTNIENISGEVKVFSKVGEGTSLKIVLPLTLAIIDGVVTLCKDQRYIIPLLQVHEFIKPTSEMLDHVSGLGECLTLRGEVIPIFKLGQTLGLEQVEENTRRILIIAINNKFKYAVEVDDILNQQQVVIKKLGEEIKNRKGIMGSSILGDGKPAFIVDIFELFNDLLKESSNYGRFVSMQNSA